MPGSRPKLGPAILKFPTPEHKTYKQMVGADNLDSLLVLLRLYSLDATHLGDEDAIKSYNVRDPARLHQILQSHKEKLFPGATR